MRWASCVVAGDYEQFEAGVVLCLREDSPDARRGRGLAMRRETWEQKVADLGEQVMRVAAKKGRRG